MSVIIATLALILALGALWFSTEIAKRTDVRSKISLKPHLAPMSESLKRAEQQIRDLSSHLEVAEREIKLLKTMREEMLANEARREGETAALAQISAPTDRAENQANSAIVTDGEPEPNFRPTGMSSADAYPKAATGTYGSR